MDNWFDKEDEAFDMAATCARHQEMEAAAALDQQAARAAQAEQEPDAGIYPEHEWEAIIEAVLFTMGNSVELGQLATAIDQSEKIAARVVESLQKRYQEEKRGMQIIELDGSYQMSTRAVYYENLIRVAKAPKKQVLSEVVLETLSIIAYKQPVTKGEITKIRGVASDHAINRLVEYGLVYEVGRLDAPGRPALFATTEEFLRRFGVGSTTDLPTMNPEQEEEIKQEVEEELQFHTGMQEAAATNMAIMEADEMDTIESGTDDLDAGESTVTEVETDGSESDEQD